MQLTLGHRLRASSSKQDLLAHQIPNGDPAAIVECALDALLIQVHKRKTGITAKPRLGKPTSDSSPQPSREVTREPSRKPNPATRRSRRVKVAARREVWPGDEASCGFIGEDGRRCNETRGLELAHVHPWGQGWRGHS